MPECGPAAARQRAYRIRSDADRGARDDEGVGLERLDQAAHQRRRESLEVPSPPDHVDPATGMTKCPEGPGDGRFGLVGAARAERSEEHTSELQSRPHLVCRLLL